jgi:hypothetical protein
MYIGRKKSASFLGNKYLGSGIHLKNAVRKYGEKNFSVDILKECTTEEDLYNSEEYYIRELNAVGSDKFYNLSPGGIHDGFIYGPDNISNRAANRKLHSRLLARTNKQYQKKFAESRMGNKLSDETKLKISASNKGKRLGIKDSDETRAKKSLSRIGYRMSEESKLKCSINNRGKRTGMKSSEETVAKLKVAQQGRRWINNGSISKKVKAEDVDKYISLGFVFGRLPK